MMSSVYTFEWPRACTGPVYITGTFDNWTKSTRMHPGSNGKYVATLELPKGKKVLFKFVVDGKWVTIPDFKVERDEKSGIENNVLYPADIEDHNNQLVATLAEGGADWDSPALNTVDIGSHSEAETTTSFSNVSYGEFSPFQQCESYGTTKVNELDFADEDVENLSDDLVSSSAQITLSGKEQVVSAETSARPTLVNIQEGNRQIRYYTSMSLLSKFTEYFK